MKYTWKHNLIGLFLASHIFLSPLQAQTPSVDSLKNLLNLAQTGTDSIDILNELAWEYQSVLDSGVDSSLPYALKALELSEQKGYLKGLGDSYSRLGDLAKMTGDIEMAIFLYQNCINIRQELYPGSNSVAGAHNNLANALCERGYYEAAVSEFQKSIQIRKRLVEQEKIHPFYLAKVYLNMSSALAFIGQYQEALDALHQIQDLGMENEFGSGFLSSYALVFNTWGITDSAIVYYQKSLEVAEKNGSDSRTIAEILNQMAQTLIRSGKFELALNPYLSKGRKILAADGPSMVQANLFRHTGIAHDSLGNAAQALVAYRRYQQIESELENVGQQQSLQQLDLLYGVEAQRRKAQQLMAEKRQEEQGKVNALLVAILVILLAGAGFWFLLSRSRHQKRELMGKMEELRYQTNEQIMNSLTQQRKHIASDLHNNLGNMLATIRLSLSGMETYVRQWEDKYSQTFFSATEQLDEACVTVRDMSRGMYTDKLNQFGLIPALEILKERLELSDKLEVELDYAGLETGVPNDLEVLIYQTFQELVTNSLKHSEASLLTLQLSSEAGEISLLFEDNGKGFDQNKLRSKPGIGLPNLRQQIEDAEGSFTIDSQLGRGTTVIIEIPFLPDLLRFET